jgi:hypothetical protein
MTETKRSPGRPMKMVRARLTNLESSGSPLEFSWEGKLYKGPTGFQDGNIYEIPERLMKHVNSVTRPEPVPVEDEHGNVIGTKWSKRQRFAFNPVSDDELD